MAYSEKLYIRKLLAPVVIAWNWIIIGLWLLRALAIDGLYWLKVERVNMSTADPLGGYAITAVLLGLPLIIFWTEAVKQVKIKSLILWILANGLFYTFGFERLFMIFVTKWLNETVVYHPEILIKADIKEVAETFAFKEFALLTFSFLGLFTSTITSFALLVEIWTNHCSVSLENYMAAQAQAQPQLNVLNNANVQFFIAGLRRRRG